MIVLLVVIGVAAIAILGRKYANTALPTVLALALCCCMSLGIYFYASVFSHASELIFAAVGGVLLSVGVYALTNSLCNHRAVLKDAMARIAGPRKPLVEFVESGEEERDQKTYENQDRDDLLTEESKKEVLPKLWGEEEPESEKERRAFDEALDEALFADTKTIVEAEMEEEVSAKISMLEEDAAAKSSEKERIEEAAVEAQEDAFQEPFVAMAASPLALGQTLDAEEVSEDADTDQLIIEEEENDIPPLTLEETLETEEISEDADTEQFITEEESDIPPPALEETLETEETLEDPEAEQLIVEEESDIPPLALEEIVKAYTFSHEPDFLPPLDEEDEETFNKEVEITSEQAEVMEDEADFATPADGADEPVKEFAFEPVPAPDDIKRRKDEAMVEVKSLVARRQYSDALTSLFVLLNSGFALSEDEKRQLLIIMKLLKEKGI